MAEYTPTEGDARNYYAAGRIVLGSRDAGPPSERDAEFDRFLAEVRCEAAEKAQDEGSRTVQLRDFEAACDPNPYRKDTP